MGSPFDNLITEFRYSIKQGSFRTSYFISSEYLRYPIVKLSKSKSQYLLCNSS